MGIRYSEDEVARKNHAARVWDWIKGRVDTEDLEILSIARNCNKIEGEPHLMSADDCEHCCWEILLAPKKKEATQ